MSRYWLGDISPEMEEIELRFNIVMTENKGPKMKKEDRFWNDPEELVDAWMENRKELLHAEKYNDQNTFKRLLGFRWDLNCRLDMFAEVMDEEEPVYDKKVWELLGMMKAGRVFTNNSNYKNFKEAAKLYKESI